MPLMLDLKEASRNRWSKEEGPSGIGRKESAKEDPYKHKQLEQ